MNKLLVILSPSSQPENKCLICDSEETHCRHLAELIKQYLSHYPNIEVKIIKKQDPKLSVNEKLRAIVDESNSYCKDFEGKKLHVPLHSNASARHARGHLIMFFPGNFVTRRIADFLSKNMGVTTRVEGRSDLYELRATHANAIYFETYFHDNMPDAWEFHTKINVTANLISSAILKHSIE